MLKKLLTTAALIFLASSAFAQEGGRSDISVNAAGLWPKRTAANGTVQTATKSGAFLGTARYRFNARHAIAANYFRGNDSQIFTNQNTFRIQSNVTELTGAYVFTPFETKKYEPFVFAGAGALVFNPYNSFVNTVQVSVPSDRQTEFAVLYGAGVDWRIFSSAPLIGRLPLATHLALRLQYRGLFYKAPNFNNPSFFTGSRGHLAEAAIGIAFKF